MWSHKFFLKDNFMLYIQVPRNDSQKKVPKKVARKSTHKKCPEKVLTKSTQKGAQIRRSVNQSFVNVAFPSLFWGRLFKQCNIWWLRDIINILTVYFCFYFWTKKDSTVYQSPLEILLEPEDRLSILGKHFSNSRALHLGIACLGLAGCLDVWHCYAVKIEVQIGICSY